MGNWQKHNTKEEKYQRRQKYYCLRAAGYCSIAAIRARDFTWNKVNRLCYKFSKDFNTMYKYHT